MRASIAALALTGSMLGSCVLVNAPSNHEAHSISPDDFCTRLAEVICDGITHCCDNPSFVMMNHDRGMCVGRIQTVCTNGNPNVSQLVHDRRTGYDPALGGDVIAEARYRASVCDVSVAAWTHEREGFLRVFPGTVAPGNMCLMGDPTSAANAAAFLSCNDPGYACVIESATHGACNQRVGAMRPCITDFDCTTGLYCAPGAVLARSTCAPLLPTGGACSHNLADQPTWCASGVCTSGQCVAATLSSVYCLNGIF